MNNQQTVPFSHLLSAIFLITGACVGGGMLALPVEMGVSGLFPSLLVMAISWAFMTLTGLLLVEANLWMEEGAHVMTMASRLLGFPGRVVSVVLFLFMGYGSLVAYNAAGTDFIIQSVHLIGGITLTYWQAAVLFAVIFGLLLFTGTHFLGRINTILIGGMVVTYLFMVFSGIPEIQASYYEHAKWGKSFFGLPLVLATFSYQMIVPSLTPYLKRNAVALKRCVFWGTTIPFVVYAIWQLIVLGIVPLYGEYGLEMALSKGKAATWSLRHFVDSPFLSFSADSFAFFALVTSYLAIALGTYDFVADSLRIPKKGLGKISVGALVVIPTLVFAIKYSNAFIVALGITGGFGDSILNGLIPILMVYVGRYRRRIEGPYTVFGGKPLLGALSVFALIVIYVQILELFQ